LARIFEAEWLGAESNRRHDDFQSSDIIYHEQLTEVTGPSCPVFPADFGVWPRDAEIRYGSWTMIYNQKINWQDPNMQGAGLAFSQSKFKSAVLDYHIQVEGELGDIIKRLFRDQEAYKIRYVPFRTRIDLVRAPIGKTPDDEFWDLIKSLGNLRNQYSHSRFTETEAGQEKIQEITDTILRQLQNIRSDIKTEMLPNQLEVITQAHFMVQIFFRVINEALDKEGRPKATLDLP